MNFNVPYRKIFLEDSISRQTTGVSPIAENQKLANKYFYAKRFYYLSLLSSSALAYLAYNKTYTKRSVYFMGFVVTLALSYSSHLIFTKYAKKCQKEFDCSKELLPEYAWFYHYAHLDKDNTYELQRKAT